jgi:hypothetical protein
MATPTYDVIATTTLTSAATSITFSSLDQSYRDIIISARTRRTSTAAGETVYYFNNDTANNYSWLTMRGGAGTSIICTVQSAIGTIRPSTGVGDPTADFYETILQVFDYSQTNKHKSGILQSGNSTASATTNSIQSHAFRYATNTAITTINIGRVDGGSLDLGTTVTIYGIAG